MKLYGGQRWLSTLLTVCLLILLTAGCASPHPVNAEILEAPVSDAEDAFYAVRVGKGDALILKTGGRAYLIDAGKRIRWGQVHTALTELGITRLDGVFLTHTDKDHSGGLMPLALSDIEVGTWYAPRYYAEPKKEKKHPAVMAAAVRNREVTFLEAGDTAEGIFTVLAPFSLDEANEDDNSLVMRCTIGGVSFLLTGDMEHGEEKQLLKSGADLACTVLKVPNHGDSDACSDRFLAGTGAKIAVISTDPEEKDDTPSEPVLESLTDAKIAVYRTDLCGGMIRIACENGQATVDELVLPAAPDVSGIIVRIPDAKTERITLTNTGKETAELTGSYLVSLKGEDIFLFPAGTVLAPGAILTVGTLSAKEESDLVWGEKNVFSDKKEDGVTLYDASGEPVLSYWIGED